MTDKNTILEILVITNPLCNSCIKTHHVLEELISLYKHLITIRIRFNVPCDNRHDSRTLIAEKLLQLHVEETEEVFKKIFKEWLNKPSLSWLNKYGVNQDIRYNKILQQHRKWCINEKVNETPTIFINGKEFPSFYNLNSLKYFIEAIIQFYKKEIVVNELV